MKTLNFMAAGQLMVGEKPMPSLNGSDMVVKVRRSAICGTDIRIYKNGHFKIPCGEKRVLGHEIVGEIACVAEDVSYFKRGMRVALVPNIGCGHCEMCLEGHNELCPDYEAFGISIDGGFEEYVYIPDFAVKAGNILALPDDLGYDEAILAEPLSCCHNSYQALGTKPGDTVLVIGAGPIGAFHVMLNRLAGATTVISADILQTRLEKMLGYGADILINSAEEDLEQAVLYHTNGRGADIVITACSVPALQAQSLRLAARHGKINFFGGLPEGKSNVLMDTNLMHYKELKILGTTGSSIFDYKKAIDILASRRLPLEGMISRKYRIEDGLEAFQYAMSGQGMKTVFDFD